MAAQFPAVPSAHGPMTTDELPRSWMPDDGSERARRMRGLLWVLFALYVALLVWVVVWKLEVPHIGRGGIREIKLVPFAPDACDGASAPSEVLANVLLFIPFGVYLGLVAPTWTWWRIAGTVVAASLSLEVAQYALAVGSADITDLITNTAGGPRRARPARPGTAPARGEDRHRRDEGLRGPDRARTARDRDLRRFSPALHAA